MTSLKDYSPWVPFDLYDFFGYLFPGTFLLVTIALFLQLSGLQDLACYTNKCLSIYNEAPFLVSVLTIVVGIILIYTLGHFVAMFGQILFDRIFLDEIVQHPIFALLKIKTINSKYSNLIRRTG